MGLAVFFLAVKDPERIRLQPPLAVFAKTFALGAKKLLNLPLVRKPAGGAAEGIDLQADLFEPYAG
jgi:hypothetical protein